MKIPEIITAEWLEDMRACKDAVEEFREAYPEGAKFDKKLIE